MGFIRNRVAYDRKQLLADADRARGRGRWRRAISLYRVVLAAEPHDPDLQTRIAPLLARSGQHYDAWQCYRRAAQSRIKNKQSGEALRLYREAAASMPRQLGAWQWIAKLERQRGRAEQARDALLEGRRKMKGRRRRPEAITLLRSAMELDPENDAITVDLARLLDLTHQTPEALALLDRLADRRTGIYQRRARGAQWRMQPSLRHTWYWIRAAWGARDDVGARFPARTAS